MKSFTGFPAAAWGVLEGLAADNTSVYFDAHRDQYRRCVATPAATFVDAVVPALRSSVHPALQGDPRVGRSLFRINRDTRFGSDKTPYKTHIDFLFWIGDGEPRQSPACIVRITATSVVVGAGQVGLEGAALERYRSAVAGPTSSTLRTIVDQLVADGCDLSDVHRVRVPSPFAQDHANADLLRRDGFHASHTNRHPVAISDGQFISWITTELGRYRPLLDWLSAYSLTAALSTSETEQPLAGLGRRR
ncbi:MAG: TIGR02453 family protein [Acidimicrobiia bacterium]